MSLLTKLRLFRRPYEYKANMKVQRTRKLGSQLGGYSAIRLGSPSSSPPGWLTEDSFRLAV
eukprot:5181647-Pleurochrysis_carterae.AAC.1